MADPVSGSPLPHVDGGPVPVSADLHVILQHYEQLAPCPGPRVMPGPGLVNTPVLRLYVDLLLAVRELEPPGKPLDPLTLGQNNNVKLESRQQSLRSCDHLFSCSNINSYVQSQVPIWIVFLETVVCILEGNHHNIILNIMFESIYLP